MTTVTLVEFILARYDDADRLVGEYEAWMAVQSVEGGTYSVVVPPGWGPGEPFDVDLMLSDIAAKRDIVDLCEASIVGFTDPGEKELARDVLGRLALPYADHRDYDESWRP